MLQLFYYNGLLNRNRELITIGLQVRASKRVRGKQVVLKPFQLPLSNGSKMAQVPKV
jgi:hypothetical protein